MFEITVEDPQKKGDKVFVWQNSWGLSTRVIGVMVMLHSDDKGLVLPPRVAKIQAIVIPVGISAKTTEEDRVAHAKRVDEVVATLKGAKVRTEIDDREG
jgi:prolyl-tRNA synthetase